MSCRQPFLCCPPLPWYFLPLPRPRPPRTSRTLASLEQHLLPSASSRAKVGLKRLCGLDSFTAALPEVKGPSCLHPGHPSHVHVHRYTVVSCLCNLSPRVSCLSTRADQDMPPKQQDDAGGEPQIRAEHVSSSGFTLCVKQGDICQDASDGRSPATHHPRPSSTTPYTLP